MKVRNVERDNQGNFEVAVEGNLTVEILSPRKIAELQHAWYEDPSAVTLHVALPHPDDAFVSEKGYCLWVTFKRNGEEIASGETYVSSI